MRTATICGSMKFEKEMMSVLFMLETKHHFNILQCIYSPEHQELSEKELTALAQAHYKKIELSDAIYVLDINGYIGEQVTKEIAYAKSLGKEIIYHSGVVKKCAVGKHPKSEKLGSAAHFSEVERSGT